ncbi:hypothetical protein EPN15_03845 [Patescibacteria group bacterium]|nr:MAG: hypothetical protein EPN15_03845 [Patescibacteria group bacterium]
MDERRDDRRVGEETLQLQGKQYILYLQGGKWCGPRWVGSEYYTATPDHYWYEGIGKITKLDANQYAVFAFKTWEDRSYGRVRSLKDFILISDYWYYGYQKVLSIVQNRQPDLVDYLCEQVFNKYDYAQEAFPNIHFNRLPHSQLVQNGLVFDEAGQIHLPL